MWSEEIIYDAYVEALACFDFSFSKLNTLIKYLPENRKDLWLKGISYYTNLLYSSTIKGVFAEGKISNERAGYTYGFVGKETQNLDKLGEVKNSFDSIYRLPLNNTRKFSSTIDSESYFELMNIIDFFKNKGDINLLLVNSPKLDSSTQSQLFLDSLQTIVKNNSNINVLELNSPEVKRELNFGFEDFYDFGHLKASGAYKLTNYFSNYVLKTYNLDHSFKQFRQSHKLDVSGINKEFFIKDIQVLLDDYHKTDFRIILDSSAINNFQFNTVINVFPKKGYENKLLEYSKSKNWKSDNGYCYIKDFTKLGDVLVGRVKNNTHLTKDEIEKVVVYFFDSKNKLYSDKLEIEF